MDRHARTIYASKTRKSSRTGQHSSRPNLDTIFHGSIRNFVQEYSPDSTIIDDDLAPVMLGIDAIQLIDDENKVTKSKTPSRSSKSPSVNSANDPPREDSINIPVAGSSGVRKISSFDQSEASTSNNLVVHDQIKSESTSHTKNDSNQELSTDIKITKSDQIRVSNLHEFSGDSNSELEDDPIITVRRNHISDLIGSQTQTTQDEYEFIPKSSILNVYSNDPEVNRFLRQLPKIANEFGYDEQNYKCNSCRRPIGLAFGESRLCYFDGHHYCSECHLREKSVIPARVLCNWDFEKYAISKRNQHFLLLISNEPMFELKKIAPLLYETCPELRELHELRQQAFFIRSYCFTCVHDSISLELTKLVWPREHLIKQLDLYSLEDLIQVKNGSLRNILKNVITFGRNHVLSCMLCCLKGFICEICKSSQIIYPFDTESVHRCNSCQSIYHKNCFKSLRDCDACPRCKRLKARVSNQ